MIKKIIYKYKIYCAIGFAIILGGVLFTTNHHNKKIPVVDALEIQEDEKAPINELETYNIDIKGAVKEPGVYKIVKGSIIDDAINLAGGLKKEAYTKNINLSKKVTDEMVIYIYTKSEYNKLNTKISNTVIWFSRRIILSIFALAISRLFCFKAEITSSFFLLISYTFLFLCKDSFALTDIT